MRVLTTIKSSPSFGPPPQALMDAIGEYSAEGFRDGYLLDTGGLMPGRFVQLRSGEVEVTDGPFTETKEIVGGYAIFECRSLEEGVEFGVRFMELHKANWPGWEGEVEVRPMFGPNDSGD